MPNLQHASFHDNGVALMAAGVVPGLKEKIIFHMDTKFIYEFENFFHPFVGELISKLNRDSLKGMLDATWQANLARSFFDALYHPTNSKVVEITSHNKEIDVSTRGPYANYNWELFFHIPLTVATHLSKTQRFAEAQRWFHYIFDPTCSDTSIPTPQRFWKFLGFRQKDVGKTIDGIIQILSKPAAGLSPDEKKQQDEVLENYRALLDDPFHPHVVARSRPIAYQYSVVMKYLDNLIAWGDNLFQQYTVEAINEATQLYVLAANLLGARPQRIPPRGVVRPKTFAQLKAQGLGPIGDAFVELEGVFPFNLAPAGSVTDDNGSTQTLFGIGRALYFCIPRNEKMIGYWDTVEDRLFKIRHCMDIEGIVRSLALFDPPIDPGMLVKAAAAGIDISSIVSGLNRPIGPVRCLTMIQKALELCGEVRALGGALLSALEKGDSEHLALIRQRHEIQIQQMTQEVRFLQWAAAQESTKSLMTSRATALERLHYYQRLLGLPADPNAPDALPLDFSKLELTEENFAEAYNGLVGQYDKAIAAQPYPQLKLAEETSSPAGIAGLFGASGPGRLYLKSNEDAELNSHLPRARDTALLSSASNALAAGFAPVPDPNVNLHFWGIGGSVKLNVGTALVAAAKIAGDVFGIVAGWEREQAGMASRTAAYERRADDWVLQYNLAAHELMQVGRQILTSLIAEQIAYHEYLNIQQQIKNAQEVNRFLHDKFTNEELYGWMQGEISRLYYEYYRFAFDTARKAERTMKQELMRPELETQDFVKFNYWDGGRKGLLSGEALHLDVKRMEMAYHENNKRELELTRHVSLRQLNPVALLTLKATGSCQVTIPEWLYDLDCPGHYMRRIKSVALSIPAVVGPYTTINCTLSLLKSSLRKSALSKDGEYARQGSEDDRFVDYAGAVQSIVTSGSSNDSGLFETNLRDERFLPFEGAGAESTWKLDLPDPKLYPTFDYATISDVILHIRYTARQGVLINNVTTALEALFQEASQSNLALLFSLRHDFPTEWSAFVNGKGNDKFAATIRKDYFPYFTQGKKKITITGLQLYDANDVLRHEEVGNPAALTDDLSEKAQFTLSTRPTPILTRLPLTQVYLILSYTLEM
jgi:Tc toxin complex TcA C-terminal TcB-binding domain